MTSVTAPRAPRTAGDVFFLACAVTLAVVVFIGFARSFYLAPLFPSHPRPAEPLFLAHGISFTAWVLLLVGQAWLVRSRRLNVHRQLGIAGAVLAVVMVWLGLWGALVGAARPGGFIGIPVPPLQFLIVPVTDMLLFSMAVGLALWWRHRPDIHKRLMVLATIGISTAAFARWPVIGAQGGVLGGFIMTDLLVLAVMIYDWRTRSRIHRATLIAGAVLIISQPLRLVLSSTQPWIDTDQALIRLVT
jgi:uncharacterized membrane protein YozB (DUF420 family)